MLWSPSVFDEGQVIQEGAAYLAGPLTLVQHDVAGLVGAVADRDRGHVFGGQRHELLAVLVLHDLDPRRQPRFILGIQVHDLADRLPLGVLALTRIRPARSRTSAKAPLRNTSLQNSPRQKTWAGSFHGTARTSIRYWGFFTSATTAARFKISVVAVRVDVSEAYRPS